MPDPVKLSMDIELYPMRFPNFISIRGVREAKISVGDLTDKQAEAYWEGMQRHWMEHVRKRRGPTDAR